MRHHPIFLPIISVVFLLTGGCTASNVLRIIEVRDVGAAGGSPRIEEIRDIGTLRVPREGEIPMGKADGRAVIGELLLIKGSNFGKQPRVTVGGRGAAVLAHVKGNGVVVRVPWGIDAGEAQVGVVHSRGTHSATYPVKRLGLCLTGDAMQLVEVGQNGKPGLAGPALPLPGARAAAFSFDGSVAYVATDHSGVQVRIYDLTGPAPRLDSVREFPGTRVLDVVTAAQAPMGALVTDTHVAVFDSVDPLHPAFYAPNKISTEIQEKQILSVAIGGQGKVLGMLLVDLNEVALFDISDPAQLAQLTMAHVLPGERLQVVRDLKFSDDGSSLWVVSGDTVRSVEGGLLPSRLTMLRVTRAASEGGTLKAKVVQSWELGEGLAPMELVLARGEPQPPGTAIRSEPSSSAVYVSTIPSDVLKGELDKFIEGKGQGSVIRSGLGKEPQVVMAGPWLLASQSVVGQNQVAVALGWAGAGPGQLQRVVAGGKAWEGTGAHKLLLGSPIKVTDKKKIFWPGVLRAQP